MPPLLTYAARAADGLPMVVATQQGTIGGAPSEQHKQQAKELLKRVAGSQRTSASKMSIDTSSQCVFHLLHHQEEGIVYLTLTHQSYPKRLAFLFLQEVSDLLLQEMAKEFGMGWRQELETVARPFRFIKYEPLIQRKQREFADAKNTQNTSRLVEDLQDISTIMRKNIDDILDRGEKLDHVSKVSASLREKSKDFKWGTKKLTLRAQLNQYGPMVAMGLFVLLVLYLKFFM